MSANTRIRNAFGRWSRMPIGSLPKYENEIYTKSKYKNIALDGLDGKNA